MRTATQDYTLRDTQIKEGESVILWYPSANRDEEIFDNPLTSRWTEMMQNRLPLDLERMFALDSISPEWRCPSCLKKLLPRLEHVELAGEPKYTQATFVGGLKSLPIRYKLR